MKKILISIFLISGFTGCIYKSNYRKAADEIIENVPVTANMNAAVKKYTLDVPAGWTTKHLREYGIDYYFLSAPKTADDPHTNINVITEYMQNLSLDKYVEKSIEGIKHAIPSAAIGARGYITANGVEGAWYEYTMEPRGIKAALVNYIFPQDGIAYIVTAGTQTKDAAGYRHTFVSVAQSLKFSE